MPGHERGWPSNKPKLHWNPDKGPHRATRMTEPDELFIADLTIVHSIVAHRFFLDA